MVCARIQQPLPGWMSSLRTVWVGKKDGKMCVTNAISWKSFKHYFLYFANCKLTHEFGRKLPRFGSRTLSIDSEPIGGAVVLRLPCWYLAAADWKNCRPNKSPVKPHSLFTPIYLRYQSNLTVVRVMSSVKCRFQGAIQCSKAFERTLTQGKWGTCQGTKVKFRYTPRNGQIRSTQTAELRVKIQTYRAAQEIVPSKSHRSLNVKIC